MTKKKGTIDLNDGTWIKFVPKFSRIAISKTRIGFCSWFIKMNKLESYKFVRVFYNTDTRRLGFYFTNDKNASHRLYKDGLGRYINRYSDFLKDFKLTDADLKTYAPEKVTEKGKDYYIINLCNKKPKKKS